MNFKKILAMVGGLTVIVPTSLAAVACGNPQDSTKIKIDSIMEILEKGIIGSTLKTTDTQQQALDLMQNNDRVKGIAVLTFVNKEDAKSYLVDGDNSLNINIKIGSTTVSTNKAKILNVSRANDSDQAAQILNFLKAGVSGNNLVANTGTQQQALDLLNQNKTILAAKAQLSFVYISDATKKLTVGTNVLSINIKVGIITLTTDKAKVTHVNEHENIAENVKKILSAEIDGAIFSKANVGQDALKLIQNLAGVKDVATLSFVNQADASTHLVDGKNTLNINIQVDLVNLKTQAVLINVNQDADNLAIVAKELTKGIDGASLTLPANGNDALAIMQQNQTVKKYHAQLSFVNAKAASAALISGINHFEITIRIGDATATIKANVINVDKNHAMAIAETVKGALSHGIDGSKLTTSDINYAAVELMNNNPLVVNNNVLISLVDPTINNHDLKAGLNTFNININVGTYSFSTLVNVYNVNKNSDFDVAKSVQVALNEGIDGSSLSDEHTFNDALAVIRKNKIVQATHVQLSFAIPDDQLNYLTAGTNELKINIKYAQATLMTTVNVTKVCESANVVMAKKVKTELDKGIDGSKLTTLNKASDALELMKQDVTDQVAGTSLTFVHSYVADKNLVAGTNTFKVRIKVGLYSLFTTVDVNSVKAATATDKANYVKNILDKGVDGSSLKAGQNASAVLSLMGNYDWIYKLAAIGFHNVSDADSVLQAGTMTFEIDIVVKDVKVTTTVTITNISNQ